MKSDPVTAHSENESVRTISRWECPQCSARPVDCTCSYSGGSVEVWYVDQGRYVELQGKAFRLAGRATRAEQALRMIAEGGTGADKRLAQEALATVPEPGTPL